MTIKSEGQKWASKDSQALRNEEYARKAVENAPVTFSGDTELKLKEISSLKFCLVQRKVF